MNRRYYLTKKNNDWPIRPTAFSQLKTLVGHRIEKKCIEKIVRAGNIQFFSELGLPVHAEGSRVNHKSAAYKRVQMEGIKSTEGKTVYAWWHKDKVKETYKNVVFGTLEQFEKEIAQKESVNIGTLLFNTYHSSRRLIKQLQQEVGSSTKWDAIQLEAYLKEKVIIPKGEKLGEKVELRTDLCNAKGKKIRLTGLLVEQNGSVYLLNPQLTAK